MFPRSLALASAACVAVAVPLIARQGDQVPGTLLMAGRVGLVVMAVYWLTQASWDAPGIGETVERVAVVLIAIGLLVVTTGFFLQIGSVIASFASSVLAMRLLSREQSAASRSRAALLLLTSAVTIGLTLWFGLRTVGYESVGLVFPVGMAASTAVSAFQPRPALASSV